jgi:hypothetical protein
MDAIKSDATFSFEVDRFKILISIGSEPNFGLLHYHFDESLCASSNSQKINA